jgi:hypothetical protein
VGFFVRSNTSFFVFVYSYTIFKTNTYKFKGVVCGGRGGEGNVAVNGEKRNTYMELVARYSCHIVTTLEFS